MKKTISIVLLIVSSLSFAQVAIGKDNVTNTSVSLEFAAENRGLILPYVENKSGITVDGTLIYDTAEGHKVKYLKEGNWINLSEDDGTSDTIGVADITIQNGKTDQVTAKTAIGTPTNTDGILVLEASDKAMILPKVASPHINIIDPAPGMLVYDTTKKQLAVYNGKVWSFWKP